MLNMGDGEGTGGGEREGEERGRGGGVGAQLWLKPTRSRYRYTITIMALFTGLPEHARGGKRPHMDDEGHCEYKHAGGGVGSEPGGVGRLVSANVAGGKYARCAITGDEGVLVAQGGNAYVRVVWGEVRCGGQQWDTSGTHTARRGPWEASTSGWLLLC